MRYALGVHRSHLPLAGGATWGRRKISGMEGTMLVMCTYHSKKDSSVSNTEIMIPSHRLVAEENWFDAMPLRRKCGASSRCSEFMAPK